MAPLQSCGPVAAGGGQPLDLFAQPQAFGSRSATPNHGAPGVESDCGRTRRAGVPGMSHCVRGNSQRCRVQVGVVVGAGESGFDLHSDGAGVRRVPAGQRSDGLLEQGDGTVASAHARAARSQEGRLVAQRSLGEGRPVASRLSATGGPVERFHRCAELSGVKFATAMQQLQLALAHAGQQLAGDGDGPFDVPRRFDVGTERDIVLGRLACLAHGPRRTGGTRAKACVVGDAVEVPVPAGRRTGQLLGNSEVERPAPGRFECSVHSLPQQRVHELQHRLVARVGAQQVTADQNGHVGLLDTERPQHADGYPAAEHRGELERVQGAGPQVIETLTQGAGQLDGQPGRVDRAVLVSQPGQLAQEQRVAAGQLVEARGGAGLEPGPQPELGERRRRLR